MSASLVGSEMCIRDRDDPEARTAAFARNLARDLDLVPGGWIDTCHRFCPCLLYTSDAADDSSV
eukprot:2842990-Alexandrium_andersonii.AAC.1